MINKIISHYKVIDKLGEGGMGVLYLAEDLELNRKAVLKFLPPDMMNDQDTNLRFKREAQSAGSLSHPNIVTIYDVGVYENKTFIAMEYVEGKTLREFLKSDEPTIERITDISVQICEGLNAAHSKGITHRDIKPENILIDENGKVKIVDFGLAKVKNVSRGITKQDSTVGTLKYMSPEQIRNQNVDHRSDIWSFGVILYEMITGKYPFKGEHDASLFYSIINQSPEPLARYKSNISEGFQRVIDKSLDKDPETRYQHIDELLSDLRREKRDSGEFAVGNVKRKNTRFIKRVSLISAALVAIALIIISTNYFLNNRVKNVNPPKHTQLTFDGNICFYGGNLWDMSQISPDGQFTAYVVDNGIDQSIYVRENSGERTTEIFKGLKFVASLRWSPDSKEIFFTGQHQDSTNSVLKITKSYSSYIIPKFGGKPYLIDDDWWFACWSPTGSSLAFIALANDSIRIINSKTNKLENAFKLDGDFTQFYDIDWSTNGNRLVCLTLNNVNKKYALWSIKTDGTQKQKIMEIDKEIYSPRWSANGNSIYYLQERNGTRDLMKIEISLSTGTAESKSKVIITGLEAYGFSLSNDNKKLIYTKYFGFSNLWELLLGRDKKSSLTKKLTEGTTSINSLDISPDGKKVAFVKQGNVFIKSIYEDESKQLTLFDSECSSVSWNPNGKEIAFFSGSNIIIVDTQEGIVQKSLKNIDFGDQLYWCSDSTIFYSDSRNYNFYIFNLKTGEKKKFLKNDKNMGWINFPTVSPDNRKIATFWNRWFDTRLVGLWIISIDDSIQHQLICGYFFPIEWSSDGKFIYATNYEKDQSEILKISSDNGEIIDKIVLPFNKIGLADITPDGKTIIFAVDEENSDVWMIENFDPDVE